MTNINEFNERELEEEQGELRGFFNLDMSRFLDVIDVNIMGTVIPCQVLLRIWFGWAKDVSSILHQ